MAYLAVHIAAAFIDRAKEENKTITEKKLQCLLYFAHGFYLTLYNEPLLSQRFEAAKAGPVVHSLTVAYKQSAKNLPLVKLSTQAKHTIILAWNKAYAMHQKAFTRLTTQPGSPWANAKASPHPVLYIENSTIQRYFKQWYSADTAMPHKTYRYIVKEQPVDYLQLAFQPLMCPCCKTAPCQFSTLREPAPASTFNINKTAKPTIYKALTGLLIPMAGLQIRWVYNFLT
jgi:uncharacterized phage-associated protein